VSRSEVLLIDVDVQSAAPLVGWCARSGLRAVDANGFAPAGLDPAAVAVAVVGLAAGENAELERIRALGKLLRGAPVVALARGLGAEDGFRLCRAGVAELIALPADPLDLVARVSALVAKVGDASELAALVGQSAPMRVLRDEVKGIAGVESKVLLQGETGTGKSLVARLIHELSPRREGPFVHVDCAALSPTLIESELFGHERGAFTGAAGMRRGRFELAAGGTIFLDEIGDLDAALQSKLLRVLEDRVFERVGGSQSLPMNARVIAATCHDLMREVQRGRFRMDLYFRLNVIKLVVPALRERLEDVPALVRATSRRLCATLGVAEPAFADSFYARLATHDWPGNVRELVNVLERLLVRGESRVLEAPDLDGLLEADAAPASESSSEEVRIESQVPRGLGPDEAREAELIANALRETGGNVLRVARRLEISRAKVRHRIHKYRLEDLARKD